MKKICIFTLYVIKIKLENIRKKKEVYDDY